MLNRLTVELWLHPLILTKQVLRELTAKNFIERYLKCLLQKMGGFEILKV